MKKKYFLQLSVASLFLLAMSCNSDELTEIELDVCDATELNALTYVRDLKPIVDTKCTTGGCHGTGDFNGDFTNYQGMLPDLENGRINEEVVIDRTMPLQGSNLLTTEEFEMFQCWLSNGAPEN